jgi:hypothetical protein
MANENILERIRKQIQNANQGSTGQNSNGQNVGNLGNAPGGGFSISNGMMQAPGSAPKTLSGSYLS